MTKTDHASNPFFVSAGSDLLSGLICGLPRVWSAIGNAENTQAPATMTTR